MAAPRQRVPKLLLDAKYGPAPNPDGKYRTAAVFRKMYRSYQWTQGYDVAVAMDRPEQVRLVCGTSGTCPFSITAEFTTFTEPPLTGQGGFKISTQNYRPDHDHPAPYLPLDVAAENARLATLQHDDPSIERPPLIPVHGAAASSSGGVGAGAGAGPGRASSSVGPAGTPAPTVVSTSTYVQQTPQSPASTAGMPDAAAQWPGHAPTSQPPASSLTPQQQAQCMEPLGRFLCTISPLFVPYLGAFPANNIPLDTAGSDLVDLDSGDDNDRTLFDLFKDVRGLPPFLVTLAADGVRKAKLRQLVSGTTDIDARIAIGMERPKAERWVRSKIEEGHRMIAERERQQSAHL